MDRELPVSVWPEWKIVEKIGEGSFGKVYKAQRMERDKAFYSAIKIVSIPSTRSELKSIQSELGSDQSVKEYFQNLVEDCIQEVNIMEDFRGNSHVVAVEDYKVVEYLDDIGWDIYIRMEYLTGFLEYCEGKQLSEKEVIQLGIDLCKALEYCRKMNIIHRDIKPENIFVSRFGEFKLGDFGIARELDRTLSSFSKKGTYSYMAPEMYRGEKYDSRVDIYSLGIMLYKLRNHNRLPFMDLEKQLITYRDKENALNKRMSGEILPAPVDAGEDLAAVILKACAYDCEERYTTAEEFREELERVKYRVMSEPLQERKKVGSGTRAAGSQIQKSRSGSRSTDGQMQKAGISARTAGGQVQKSGASMRAESDQIQKNGVRTRAVGSQVQKTGASTQAESNQSKKSGADSHLVNEQEYETKSGNSKTQMKRNRDGYLEFSEATRIKPRRNSAEQKKNGSQASSGTDRTGTDRTGTTRTETAHTSSAETDQTFSAKKRKKKDQTGNLPLLIAVIVMTLAVIVMTVVFFRVLLENRRTSAQSESPTGLVEMLDSDMADESEKEGLAEDLTVIRERASEIVNELDTYHWIGTEKDGRITYLNTVGELRKILIYPNSSKDGLYEEYYFWDDQLFFAYIWADSTIDSDLDEGEIRADYYYYKDGNLIRWIDENNMCHDYETDNEEYHTLGEKYWNRALEYSKGFE